MNVVVRYLRTFTPAPAERAGRSYINHFQSTQTMLATLMGRLRLVGFVEGISFLLLLFIAMPLKYIWDMPLAVRVVGSIHGALFILFIYFIVQAYAEKNWSRRELMLALLSSVIPFGTFYADKHLFKKYA